MVQGLLKGLIEKDLKIKKAPSVQGSVTVHFPNPGIKDIILTTDATVDVFKRIGITVEDIKRSNLEDHLLRGDIVITK